MAALPRTFDPLFKRYGGSIPVNFLRALAKRESNFDPRENKPPAYGLLQVVPTLRESYNRRHGTSYSQNDMLDPDINVRVVTDHLHRLVRSYGKHPDKNMKENWRNPEYVALIVAGHNSGGSEKGGVGRVASYLEERGIPVTHRNVFKYSAAAGATRHLRNPTKENWQRSVVNLFYNTGGPGTSKVVIGGAVALAAYLVYRLTR